MSQPNKQHTKLPSFGELTKNFEKTDLNNDHGMMGAAKRPSLSVQTTAEMTQQSSIFTPTQHHQLWGVAHQINITGSGSGSGSGSGHGPPQPLLSYREASLRNDSSLSNLVGGETGGPPTASGHHIVTAESSYQRPKLEPVQTTTGSYTHTHSNSYSHSTQSHTSNETTPIEQQKFPQWVRNPTFQFPPPGVTPPTTHHYHHQKSASVQTVPTTPTNNSVSTRRTWPPAGARILPMHSVHSMPDLKGQTEGGSGTGSTDRRVNKSDDINPLKRRRKSVQPIGLSVNTSPFGHHHKTSSGSMMIDTTAPASAYSSGGSSHSGSGSGSGSWNTTGGHVYAMGGEVLLNTNDLIELFGQMQKINIISKALNDFAAFGVQHTLENIPANLFDGVLNGSVEGMIGGGQQQKQLDPEMLNLVIRVLDELPDQTLDMVSAHVDCLKMIVTGWQGVKRIIHHHKQQQQQHQHQHQQHVMQMQMQQQQHPFQIGQFQGQGNMSMYPTPGAPMTMPQQKNSIAVGQVMTNQQQQQQQQKQQQQTHQRQQSQQGKQPLRTSRLTRRATQNQRPNHKPSKSEPTFDEITKLRKANMTIPAGSGNDNGDQIPFPHLND
ncbi:unnamed protein product [Ambrosiozyma monospora]|uniref:Unnamed protein product n=1 Tax=Ambrosiozyma monospora TaxID=43982 RepID=A0A9W6Z2U7_AMBMO|nr:unnamed protein product [Ambrosiozyma monospora]